MHRVDAATRERRRVIEALVGFLEDKGIEKYELQRDHSSVTLSLPNEPEHAVQQHLEALKTVVSDAQELAAGQLTDTVFPDPRNHHGIVVKLQTPHDETDRAGAIVRTLKNEESELRRRGVDSLWLFGSAVTGKPGANDVDLLARFRADARLSAFDVASLQRYLEQRLERRVDLSNEKTFPSAWMEQVQRTGIRVFDA